MAVKQTGLVNITVRMRKNGRDGSWFRDTLGRRVGTRAGLAGDQAAITNAEQMAWLGNYLIELQQEQLDAGIGSDGQPMPPLQAVNRRFVERRDGVAVFRSERRLRTLWGPGINGHMRNDIRINYLDDRMAKISITRKPSRDKALANERKAPWWGLSPASSRKFAQAQAAIYGGAVEDWLDSLGLVQAGSYMVRLARALNRRKASLARRVA